MTQATQEAQAMTPAKTNSGRFAVSLYKSPLLGAVDAEWDKFVRLCSTCPIKNQSISGGVGSFDIRPRRLGELGVMTGMHRGEGGKWEGEFAAPYTAASFTLPSKQLEVFSLSMKKYEDDLRAGRLQKPKNVSLSGALAILHCGGEGALSSWPQNAFKSTTELFTKVNGIF
jgi:hypothetical protein